jgi:hypothetical protein
MNNRCCVLTHVPRYRWPRSQAPLSPYESGPASASMHMLKREMLLPPSALEKRQGL